MVKIADKKAKASYSAESQTDVDTSNILFIAAGAFNGLEKVIKRRKNVKVTLSFSLILLIVFNKPNSFGEKTSVSVQSQLCFIDICCSQLVIFLITYCMTSDKNDLFKAC